MDILKEDENSIDKRNKKQILLLDAPNTFLNKLLKGENLD